MKELIRGSFGKTFIVTDKNDFKQYVLKEIDLNRANESERIKAEEEVKILGSLNHPNIIKYYNSFWENGSLYMLTEYCEGGDLYTLIEIVKNAGEAFTEKYIVKTFKIYAKLLIICTKRTSFIEI